MIGIIVPAHNEEATIGHCIESLLAAAAHPRLQGEDVQIFIVMDACTDATGDVVAAYPVQSIEVDYQNVGRSRAAGADLQIQQGARWLAFTDADTAVPVSWLADQLRFQTDAVCGTVKVDDWSLHSDAVRERYDSLYTPIEGHQHIHGANLGVDARAYKSVGGFKPLKAHEDVHLINDLKNAGASITWTTVNCVTTSARLDCRCREGFGDYLRSLAHNSVQAIA
ncbi:glycosyl transferase [Pseudomonas rhizosphaerae]|uniref:Glycosyl transferase n=1 Tax=Pseudomonas rhizosphaerae TaxID=216142 RepID=A0A089YRZ2_9PSED|nr:glycosyltransferase [Pseudomonas rhizosphaerae]AIS17182.1 glycosyl transferase [Pseudomonas rhizosphaerae]